VIDFDDIIDLIDGIDDFTDISDITDSVDNIGSALDAIDFTDLDSDIFADLISLDLTDTSDWADSFQFGDVSSSIDFSFDPDMLDSLQDIPDGVQQFDGLEATSEIYGYQCEIVPDANSTQIDDVRQTIENTIADTPDRLMPKGSLEISWHDYSVTQGNLTRYGDYCSDGPNGNPIINLYDHAENVKHVLEHEIGHHIFINHPEWQSQLCNAIISDGADDWLKNHLLKYPVSDHYKEAAAEAYAYYRIDPELFSKMYPKAYAFIKSLGL